MTGRAMERLVILGGSGPKPFTGPIPRVTLRVRPASECAGPSGSGGSVSAGDGTLVLAADLRSRLRTSALPTHALRPPRPWMVARLVSVAAILPFGAWIDAAVDPRVVLALAAWVVGASFAQGSRIATALDVLLAAGLVFVTGGVLSPFIFFVLATVGQAGVDHGGVTGAGAGAVVSVARIAALIATEALGRQPEEFLVTSLTIFPLAGLAAGMSVQARRSTGHAVLQQANRLLVQLREVTGDLPGGLDVATVAGAAVAEIRSVTSSDAVVVFAGEDRMLHPVAGTGDRGGVLPLTTRQLAALVGEGRPRVFSRSVITSQLGDLGLPCPHWLLVPLRSRGVTVGAFALGFEDPAAARRASGEILSLAAETALALDNAQLLEATTARAAETVRRRIAHDLHDSVAQSLAHIKMELELLTMLTDEPDQLRGETLRLSRVAGRALNDVRETITGLRSDPEAGVVSVLRQHVSDLHRPGGPRLTFHAVGHREIESWARPDILHIAQEALSNAIRHASARTITVTLEVDDDVTELVVEDDGCGVGQRRPPRNGGGVGLRAMQERAAHLGGELAVRPRVGGGTVVQLNCPRYGAGLARQVAEQLREGAR